MKSSVTLAIFQVPNGHTWLVIIILDSVDREHFHNSESLLESTAYGLVTSNVSPE